jgi:hypothetical protein
MKGRFFDTRLHPNPHLDDVLRLINRPQLGPRLARFGLSRRSSTIAERSSTSFHSFPSSLTQVPLSCRPRSPRWDSLSAFSRVVDSAKGPLFRREDWLRPPAEFSRQRAVEQDGSVVRGFLEEEKAGRACSRVFRLEALACRVKQSGRRMRAHGSRADGIGRWSGSWRE